MPRKTEAKDLTQRQLDCYRLRHEEKMNLVPIGETLGISEAMVRKHLKLAEGKLQHKSLPKPILGGPAERIERTNIKLAAMGKDPSNGQLIELMQEKRLEALVMLDKICLTKESGRGLAQIISILTDKMQLLRGEPTAITKIEDVRKMDEVAKLLLAEVKRRGLVLDEDAEKMSIPYQH